MSSARDITRAAWPPRSVYLDYPLGHTSGRPHEPELNLQILRDTFAAFESLSAPGSMAHLRYRWPDSNNRASDNWKDKVFAPVANAEELPECAVSGGEQSTSAVSPSSARPSRGTVYDDDRVERFPTPQYQTDEDAAAARSSHDSQDCLVCAGIDY